MRPDARSAFVEMARDCGPTIHRMQSSCEMYLTQYLAAFPDERDLLKAALRAGVPQAVLDHDGRTGYDDHLVVTAERFAKTAGVEPAAATWAVEAWADGLGRPAGSVAPDADPAAGRYYPDDRANPGLEKVAKTAMAAIVTAGGFVGGFLGTALFPVVLFVTDMSLASQMGDVVETNPNDEIAMLVVAVLAALFVGAVGGAAALAAWLFAGGEEEPWATSSVACGTAFVMVFIAGFTPLGFFFKPVAFFAAVFATTYKSAARGGNY